MMSILCIVNEKNDYSETENRSLQLFPKISFEKIIDGSFTKEFEKFTADQFPWRNGWVKVKTNMDMALGKKDNGEIYFGKDDYFFSKDVIDEEQLDKNIGFIQTYVDKVKKQEPNVNISIINGPMSYEILQDKLPEFAETPKENLVSDKLEKLKNVNYVNPKDELIKHKEEYIYYRTDHHWTTYGAFLTYQLWAEKNSIDARNIEDFQRVTVSNEFYGTHQSKINLENIKFDTIERFDNKNPLDITMEIQFRGNGGIEAFDSMYLDKFLKTKDKYSYFIGGNNSLVTIENKNKETERKILVIKDSYAHCFIPFLANDFQKIIVLDLRYYKKSSLDIIKEEGITDILILYNDLDFGNDRNFVYLLQ